MGADRPDADRPDADRPSGDRPGADRPSIERRERWRDQWKFGAPGHYQFRRIHEAIRTENKNRWRRSLPFADELFDRWERAGFLGFGENSSVYDSAVILGDVQVGREVWIGPGVILDGTGGLTIGDFTTVSSGVQIYTHSSLQRCLTGGRAPIEVKPTSIGRCSYIGAMSIVNLGASLGDHVVVAAHSMVNRSFPDLAIVGGCPAKKIGEVELVDDGTRAVLDFGKRGAPDQGGLYRSGPDKTGPDQIGPKNGHFAENGFGESEKKIEPEGGE